MSYQLNNTELQIYQKIMEAIRAGKLPKLTKIAEENFVSTTYVVKIAKKLGYSGFSELIYVSKYKQRKKALNEMLSDGHFEPEDIQLMADYIRRFSDKIIFIFGIGYSAIVADYIQKKLSKLGIFVSSSSPIDMTIPYDEYLVLFISKSGETEDVLEISKKIKRNVSKSVLVTAFFESTIGQHVDYTQIIETEHEPDLFDSRCIAFFEYVLLELAKEL